eukprot:TRINITY_DN42345_c0_g1_i1.p1 TRINITY_DN42345_c0_g1~~TRINITY_DN42345_c0_g1_i1.p1  ORF type:complete len:365 (-),score=86.04 TRINITY_DN42345_c0_g1_i1:417-1511(-)
MAPLVPDAAGALVVKPDPLGLKGICCYAARGIKAGEELLREAPLAVWEAPELQPHETLALLCTLSQFQRGGAAFLPTTAALVTRKKAACRRLLIADAAVRERASSLQADPAVAGGELALQLDTAAAAVAAELSGCSEATVRRLLGVCALNCYDFEPSGTEALFEVASRFEHSCLPNVSFSIVAANDMPLCDAGSSQTSQAGNSTTTGHLGVWKAKRAVGIGEALSVSYLSHETLQEPAAVRRQELLERFGFLCSCARCEDEMSGQKALGANGSLGCSVNGREEAEAELQAASALGVLRRFREGAPDELEAAIQAATLVRQRWRGPASPEANGRSMRLLVEYMEQHCIVEKKEEKKKKYALNELD